jgi:predicted AlkP superfamily phosphohydrolase/phosphomutase
MKHLTRRDFIKQSTAAAAVLATGCKPRAAGAQKKTQRTASGKKVIVIGFDGMDPLLCMRLMQQGRLPNLSRLKNNNGFRPLATSNPPQSPVAWANFINGAGPGSHGIFDFIHRDPEKQAAPFFAAAETIPGVGYLELGEHKIQLDFWPFNHTPPRTVLKREGVPFWDYLDAAKISSTFYDLPSNYPPSPSRHGYHRCLAGMGTPDLLGSYGTYQHFAENGPEKPVSEGGGRRSKIIFSNETSQQLVLIGPKNTFLKKPEDATINFVVHRDRDARAAVIEIQQQTILLKQGEWSPWIRIEYSLSTPALAPAKKISGICRFYLQEAAPNFRLYVTPVNTDPADPAIQITEPPAFLRELSQSLGLFYNTGFQEDHKALSNRVFNDEEFVRQAGYVLQERMQLLDYALRNYDDGLLFFYFSSTDLQSHMLWWDTTAQHPYRSAAEAKKCFAHVQDIYCRMDALIGELLKRYGDTAHIIIMSDHGFANFRRQFNLNTWLRDNGYLGPPETTSLYTDADWSKTRAYGLGINSLYINQRGREEYGIVDPGAEREALLEELVQKLEGVRDRDGRVVICKARRSDRTYTGPLSKYAPDLIVGYSRDFRCSWKSCLGDITPEILLNNDSAWAADHCMDSSELPGILFSNRAIESPLPALTDLAPSILTAFGINVPAGMTGRNVFKL